jgi:hypothetical protein
MGKEEIRNPNTGMKPSIKTIIPIVAINGNGSPL